MLKIALTTVDVLIYTLLKVVTLFCSLGLWPLFVLFLYGVLTPPTLS